MKAAVHTIYGPPDVVAIRDIPVPTVGDHDVLVRVHVSTVNRTDCGFRSGKPRIVRLFSGLTKPKATVLGCDFAGRVERVGPAVTKFAAGDRVFGFREDVFGGHADYLAVKDDSAVARIPDNASDRDVAALTEGAHYALAFLDRAKIKAGDNVLVNGATGAIGTAAVQLLKHRGATVTATSATDHVDLVKSLGADRVIDRTTTDFTADADSYDFVVDAVGKSTFGACKRLLKPGGVYLSSELGPYSQNPLLALATPAFRRRKVVFPIPPKYTQARVEHFAALIASGALKPVIDREYPLDDIVNAHTYVETGEKIGAVLVIVSGNE